MQPFVSYLHGIMKEQHVTYKARLEAKSRSLEDQAHIQCQDDLRLLHGHTGRPAYLQEPTKAGPPGTNCPNLFGIRQCMVFSMPWLCANAFYGCQVSAVLPDDATAAEGKSIGSPAPRARFSRGP